VSAEVWEQARIAFASGSIGLRALARKMNIPPGTMLARASFEAWSKMIASAKQLSDGEQSLAIKPTVLQSVAANMQERGQRYTERMAGVSEKVLPHLEKMQPGAILDSARNIEQYDRVARRNYGLDNQPPDGGGPIQLAIMCDRAAVQVISNPA
jgi:hypothetical protein